MLSCSDSIYVYRQVSLSCSVKFELQLGLHTLCTNLPTELTTVRLHDVFSNRAYSPSDDEMFDQKADGVAPFTKLTVEGDTVSSVNEPGQVPSSFMLQVAAAAVRGTYPTRNLLRCTVRKKLIAKEDSTSRAGGYSSKVVQARISCFSRDHPSVPKARTDLYCIGRIHS